MKNTAIIIWIFMPWISAFIFYLFGISELREVLKNTSAIWFMLSPIITFLMLHFLDLWTVSVQR